MNDRPKSAGKSKQHATAPTLPQKLRMIADLLEECPSIRVTKMIIKFKPPK